MISECVYVGAKSSRVDCRCMTERLDHDVCIYQPAAAQRTKLADRFTITGDDECLPFIQCPQHPATVVAQFPLTDLLGHDSA